MGDTCEFVLVGGCQHVKEAGGTVQENGLKYALIEQQQKVGGNRQCSEFAYGRESLLAAFVDVSGVLTKAQFVVQG